MPQDVTIMDVFTSIDPIMWCGTIATVLTFALEIYLYAKGLLFPDRNKRVEAARKAGRTVLGRQTKCYFTTKSGHSGREEKTYHATYAYTLNGEEKTFHISSPQRPGHTKWLYYDKKGKVFTDRDRFNPLILLIYIIPVLVGMGVVELLGYEF